jgi:protein-S-isoprenylcysteine O-methyltransferase
MRAFCLGLTFTGGVVSVVLILSWTSTPLWRLPFFFSALALFHFLEFWTTAAFNTPATSVGSFLLTANWPAYPIAHTTASLECLVRNTLFPHAGSFLPPALRTGLLAFGLLCVAVGQSVRTAAMIQAGTSFNHVVQHRRDRRHTLVTSGVYAVLRHPSYFGFWWWALGTQLVLGNGLCLAAYALVLWRFFFARVRHEEGLLVHFFGDEYVQYRRRTGTWIPFV